MLSSVILGEIILIIVYLIFMFILVQVKKDVSLGNFTWGGGLILIALYTLFAFKLFLPRQILITTLILIWGGRLILLLYLRYKKGADPRYVKWLIEKGKYALFFAFGWIFILNGAAIATMSLPINLINYSKVPGLNLLDIIGLIIWIIGFFFESVSDYQLFKFLKNPANKGHIMDQGLWAYSRHPNYFGEITMWWGIFLIALSVPFGWLSIISALTITFLLVFVTGIPWNEAVFKNNPQYQEYKKRTSMLIPWFKG